MPGPLSETELGERFAKYPLENDYIKSNFDDDFLIFPICRGTKSANLYKFRLQDKIDTYMPYLEKLKENSQFRIDHNQNYQNMIKEIKKKDESDSEHTENFGQNDLQLEEANNIMKDLIIMMDEHANPLPSKRKEALTMIPESNPVTTD